MEKEMKLMDLAYLISQMEIGSVIDFATGSAEYCCGWIGIKRIDEFDNDNPMYLVGHYGGEANVVLYHMSEYDHRIGDFCEPRISWGRYTEEGFIECCGRMIADYLEDYWEGVTETITVDLP